MKSSTSLLLNTLIICVIFNNVIRGYDIQAIEEALNQDFNVEQGTFFLFNVSDCLNLPTCFGNNPQSPYIEYNFTSWNGRTGQLRSDEAIIAIQARPPTCRYFGYTPYIITRTTGSTPTMLFASLSDTLNMNTVKNGADGTIAIVSSANLNVSSYLVDLLEKFLLPNSTNILPLPGSALNMGLESGKETFGYLSRYALFQNPSQGLAYLKNIPGYLFKVSPKTPQENHEFPYPTYRPQGPTSVNENRFQNSLSNLVAAIKSSESGFGLVQPAIDIEHLIGYENGFTCINKSINCEGDNRDARYLRVGSIYLQNSTDSHVWVVGVQHHVTGKAVYTAVAAYDQDHQLGVLSVPDIEMKGSANVFIPNDPNVNALYAIKFARICLSSDLYCFRIPVEFPGVPLNAPISFTERVYVEPLYNVAPAYGTILAPQFIRYKTSNPSSSPNVVKVTVN